MSTLINHATLVQSGLNRTDISRRLKDGSLSRVRRGVYSPEPPAIDTPSHLMLVEATLPLVAPSSVVAYESAGAVHGLPLPELPTCVQMIRRTPGHADGGTVLRMRDTALHDDEVTHVGPIPVTTLERTVADLARVLPIEWGVAVCDAALTRGLPLERIAAVVRAHPRLRGLPRARSALSLSRFGAESPAESISRLQFIRYGLPEPQLQYEIIDHHGVVVGRADFGWPEYRLVGEVDGRWKYGELLRPGQSPQDAIMKEKRRENLIRATGHWIVRWDWNTANDGPALAELVGSALRMQREALGLTGALSL
ncbi:Transcriptional regulator, AbiEi antitoxin, Type IV TA system [Tessaracoccus bendigoensis DSM 12906]|uniref:Transcriptional regulator, AbiEi antitoxin, Type IV TA system n=1 Tax=Tessaracoccus bendigoensis DSM 12906 TaxID=1123357 RepID=A0A1M6P5P8_9ACTN|nr:hypothetical protein [Tessaracoccus bendigoensis]SHK03254.1 Transcriptional regulator, AbiEi antitoxin, Type IV TA system [Tessaracoccus bendigoensis DSM 12906]